MIAMVLMGVVAAVLIGFLLYLMASVFSCKHAWEFVDKTEFAAPIETATKNGVSHYSLWAEQIARMSKKTVVIVLRCPKCGSPKVLRETH